MLYGLSSFIYLPQWSFYEFFVSFVYCWMRNELQKTKILVIFIDLPMNFLCEFDIINQTCYENIPIIRNFLRIVISYNIYRICNSTRFIHLNIDYNGFNENNNPWFSTIYYPKRVLMFCNFYRNVIARSHF